MAAVSGLILNFSGSKSPAVRAGYPKLLLHHNHGSYRFTKFDNGIGLVSRGIPKLRTLYSHHRHSGVRHILSAGGKYQLNYNDNSHTEPSWLNLARDVIWKTRGLLVFLFEQPSQLKYIEWPSFQSTLKTATLTLILVALLIVALSSVDSALSYLLALFLRKKA